MARNDSLNLGDICEGILNNTPTIDESIKQGGNDLSDKKPLPVSKGGPSEKGGFKKSLNDVAGSVIDNDEDEEENDDDESEDEGDEKDKKKEWVKPWEKDEEEDEEQIQESTKKLQKPLNTNMSNKSAFNRFENLYNKVLKENFGQEDMGNDLGALGLDDAQTDDDLGENFGDEEGGEDIVTFTLDRATAQTLIDVLKGALGEDEGGLEDSDEGDLDFGDEEGNDDDGMNFEEDEEVQGIKVAPDKKKAFQGKGNKVTSKVSPKGGKATGETTDEVGTKDGAPPITALQGKGNQVPGSTLKPKADYFK